MDQGADIGKKKQVSSQIRGITGLFTSVKCVFCLIVFGVSAALVACKLLDGIPFAGIVSSVSTMFIYAHHKIQLKAMDIQAGQLPPPPNLMNK